VTGIRLDQAVWIVLYIVGAAMIWGLLKWIIDSNPWIPPKGKEIANYALIVLVALVLIGIILSAITGTPLFR
jgi:uncharacterized Tic20 family protein